MSALVRRLFFCSDRFSYLTSAPSHRARAINLVSVEYRSAIFFNTPEQEEIAKRVTAEVQKKHFDPKGASPDPSAHVSRSLTSYSHRREDCD